MDRCTQFFCHRAIHEELKDTHLLISGKKKFKRIVFAVKLPVRRGRRFQRHLTTLAHVSGQTLQRACFPPLERFFVHLRANFGLQQHWFTQKHTIVIFFCNFGTKMGSQAACMRLSGSCLKNSTNVEKRRHMVTFFIVF
jgi:hypothetical protein